MGQTAMISALRHEHTGGCALGRGVRDDGRSTFCRRMVLAQDAANAKASADEAKKHEDFVTRMVAKGYTSKQVRLLCEWYLRVRKSS